MALAGSLDASTDICRVFAEAIAGEFVVIDARDFDVDIDPV
jgi:hypothetical protein